MKKEISKLIGQRDFSFTRWNRYNWSVFASVCKKWRIGVLAINMLFGNVEMAWTMNYNRQHNTDTDTLQLQEIEVTARRAYPARGTVMSSTVADSAWLRRAAATTIEQAIKSSPAIDVRERGALGIQADVGLYGSTHDQTMIMLNGIDFSDARTGHQSNSLPVDVDILEKITVATDIIGAGAYSGGINYITKKADSNFLKVKAIAGDYGLWNGSMSAGAAWNGATVMVSASYTSSGGYKPNTDFSNLNLYAYATLTPRLGGRSLGNIELQAGYQKRGFGSYGFYSLKYPWQWERTQTGLGSARWHRVLGEKWQASAFVSLRRNADLYQLYRDGYEAPEWYKSHNHHLTDHIQAGAQADYWWNQRATTSAGADLAYHHIYSNVLGYEMSHPKKVAGYPDAYYTREYDRSILNVWARHSQRIHRTARANVSVNLVHSPYGDNIMWGGALNWSPFRKLTADVSASRSMRLPTFTDLFYTSATHVSDPHMKPEIATTARLGLTAKVWQLTLTSNTYYRHGKNTISWTKPTADDLWHATQIATVNTLGTTLSATLEIKDCPLRLIQATYGYTYTTFNSHGAMSLYEPDYLRGKFGANAMCHIAKGLDLSVSATYFDRRGNYFDIEGNRVAYPDYFLLNTRMTWEIRRFTIHADVNNLLNRRYCDIGGLTMPGRWFSAGVTCSM